ncbi:putative DUF1212-domain-containing protein [Lyophyllum shimeji]|uniref:DUF1212-domain-containing protein n=1 Tax=Lyophyllum shimeji TaxID=47721 RepID=A0A9P3PN16_LYOSH|nr:putative DUF1212-domain-containing protein [Lyophyllum shimeji]
MSSTPPDEDKRHDEKHPGKRPGNIFLTPGTKTPRRVQWLDREKTASPHSLDEQGLDPEAFERLRQALEQHRASISRVHHYTPFGEGAQGMRSPGAPESPIPGGPPTEDPSETPSPVKSPHHYVPGNFIDATEREGLPGIPDPTDYAHRQAQKVVRAHMRRRFFDFGSRSAMRKWKLRKAQKERARGPTEPYATEDIEREADTETSQVQGKGVLSALLPLYTHDTDTSTTVSTPTISTLDDMYERPVPPRRQPSFSVREPRFAHFAPSALLSRRQAAKTRSGAGVFGPLITSTGNLTGFAAPAPSRLQPDYKRPGYRLSRYSLDETPRLPRRPLSRTQSMYDDMRVLPLSAPPTPRGREAPPSPTVTEPGPPRLTKWPTMLSIPSISSFGGRSAVSTPALSVTPPKEGEGYFDYKPRPVEDGRRKERRQKRKKTQVFITHHIAKIIERQEFILKFARAMMMFGGPSHRLQAQLKATAHVLDIELSCLYFPDVMLISFDDSATSTSSVKFIRQGSSLDIAKLIDAYELYWKVIHDELYVTEASAELDSIMRRPQLYNWWQTIIFGGMCSSFICSVSFGGSFIDSLIVFPLGALLIVIQLLSVRNELYSNVFEVTVATLFSFISAALAASRHFCYSAVASSAVVLILPGFIVLNGALELMSRNIVSGSVRLCYAVVYALFLGFGLAMGAKAFEVLTGKRVIGSSDITCALSHNPHGPWYQRTPSEFWAFLTIPMFSLFLSLRLQAPYRRLELLLLIAIACVGWVTNYFTGTKFVGQSDVNSGVGAFAVGILSNLYARLFGGNAFVIMVTGILLQVPSGLGSGGLLNFVSLSTQGNTSSYVTGFQSALKLVSVAIGLTVGLGISIVIMHPVQSKKRAGGVFSL